MKIPEQIILIKGTSPGRTTVILGGTHGDELTGIEVIKKLFNYFGVDILKNDVIKNNNVNGNIYIGFGNPAAIALKKRAAGNGRDLNRSFTDNELNARPDNNDRPDIVRARELAPLLARADYLIDIHSTSNDSPPFVCFGNDSTEREKLYRSIPVKYILTDPDKLLSSDETTEPGTTDSFVSAHGGTAIAYETGKEDDITNNEIILSTIIELLGITNQLKTLGSLNEPKHYSQTVFKITHNIIAKTDNFSFEPIFNTGWQYIVSGQLIGCYGNGENDYAKASGMLVFPKAKNKIEAEKNLYYIASEVKK